MHAGKPTPLNRMTDRCKNTTLPQTSFAGCKNLLLSQNTLIFSNVKWTFPNHCQCYTVCFDIIYIGLLISFRQLSPCVLALRLFKLKKNKDVFVNRTTAYVTSMHSSRVRTACLLPVSPSMHCVGRGGSVCSWGDLLRGGGLLWGMVSAPRGGGVCHSYPCDRMTDRCKNITLPQFRCGR